MSEAGGLHSHGRTSLEPWGPVSQGPSGEPHLQVGKVSPGAGTRAQPPGVLGGPFECPLGADPTWQAVSRGPVKSRQSKTHFLPASPPPPPRPAPPCPAPAGCSGLEAESPPQAPCLPRGHPGVAGGRRRLPASEGARVAGGRGGSTGPWRGRGCTLTPGTCVGCGPGGVGPGGREPGGACCWISALFILAAFSKLSAMGKQSEPIPLLLVLEEFQEQFCWLEIGLGLAGSGGRADFSFPPVPGRPGAGRRYQ